MSTKYYLGAAVAVPEVKHFVVEDTWAADDTLYFEINGKRLTLTVDTATIDTIVEEAAAMINGDAAVGSETRSQTGDKVGEFRLLTATYDTTDDHVILTGPSDGRPIGTVTVGNTTADDGSISADNGTDITGTGPNFFDNADNWSGGVAPVNTDDLVFDHQAAADCKYKLSQGSLQLASVTVTEGFKQSLGLPAINTASSGYPFDEPNEQYLTLSSATLVNIDASGAGHVKIDTGSAASTITVTGSGSSSERNVPPVLVQANHSSSVVNVVSGSVGLCFESALSGQVSAVYVGGGSSPRLIIGSGVTVATANTASGVCEVNGAVTTVNCTGGTHIQHAGAVTTATVSGKFDQRGTGTVTTMSLSGGTLDCSRDIRARTVTNCSVYRGSTIADPAGTLTFTNGIDLYCKPSQATLDLIANKTYTISAI
jgi:hypothetical protein